MRRDERGFLGNLSMSVAGAAAWALVGAAGCGRVSPPEAGVPLAAAPDAIAQAVCPKAYSCCNASELMGNDLAGTDEPSCEVKTAKSFADQLAAVQDAERAGRARYDGTRVEACLATIRSSTCEALGVSNHLAGIPGCERFVEPLVDAGDGCANDWECKEGRCHEGRCETLPAVAQPCADKKCAAGAVCDLSGTCVAARADGETCTQAAQCPSLQCTNGTCAQRARTCFYASGCSIAGGGPGAGAAGLVMLAALAVAAAARRPRRGARVARRASRGPAGGR